MPGAPSAPLGRPHSRVEMTRWGQYQTMAGHVQPAAAEIVALLPTATGKLLDGGTGTGNVVAAAAELGWNTIGLDLAPEQLGQFNGATTALIHADAQMLPVGSGTIQAVTSNFGLIFCADPRLALAEAARSLCSGGALCSTAWCGGGWPEPCRKILARYDDASLRNPSFPTDLGESSAARAALDDAGLIVDSIDRHHLSWRFQDLDDAAETLTSAAGGLRVLRAKIEHRGLWPEALAELRYELGDRVQPGDDCIHLDESYLVVAASVA